MQKNRRRKSHAWAPLRDLTGADRQILQPELQRGTLFQKDIFHTVDTTMVLINMTGYLFEYW
jgi:hypothetical protein